MMYAGRNVKKELDVQPKTREIETRIALLFSERRQFSEHLIKWEDKALPDKWDQNCFEYSGQPTRAEFEEAVAYQKSIGADFIKLEGDAPLSDSFGLEGGVTLTMILEDGGESWAVNPALSFRTPSLEEMEALEVQHYGALYGEDYTRRNIRRNYEKLTYHGAYLDGTLVGACYSFSAEGLTCIDGLLVHEAYRKRRVATSLMDHIRSAYPGTVLFLHADEDDTPKEMYRKMGFVTVDRLYEYLRADLR